VSPSGPDRSLQSQPGAESPDVSELVQLYAAKAAAEVAAAEALAPGAPASQGPAPADVMLVKGEPGPGDLAAGRALAGDDGRAAASALAALGLADAPAFACCSRGAATAGAKADDADAHARASRLARLALAVEPRVLIGLDALAAATKYFEGR
jgi:uracil-DNA glycosylase